MADPSFPATRAGLGTGTRMALLAGWLVVGGGALVYALGTRDEGDPEDTNEPETNPTSSSSPAKSIAPDDERRATNGQPTQDQLQDAQNKPIPTAEPGLSAEAAAALALAEGQLKVDAALGSNEQEREAPITHLGYTTGYEGHFDVQGTGVCQDYCRWVGPDHPENADPRLSTITRRGGYWSCEVPRGVPETEAFTKPLHYGQSFKYKRCSAYMGAAPPAPDLPGSACKPQQKSHFDYGHANPFNGWYDVQGCGYCNDYCRWVGDTKPANFDPLVNTSVPGGGHWSCRLAGGTSPYTPDGTFGKSFPFKKCASAGARAPPQSRHTLSAEQQQLLAVQRELASLADDQLQALRGNVKPSIATVLRARAEEESKLNSDIAS